MICDPLRLRRFLLWMVSFAWMGLIFWFSSQTATESSASSDSMLSFFLRFFRIDDMDRILNTGSLHRIGTYILRKSAHLFLFTILGGLLCVTICQYSSIQSRKRRRRRGSHIMGLPLSDCMIYKYTTILSENIGGNCESFLFF